MVTPTTGTIRGERSEGAAPPVLMAEVEAWKICWAARLDAGYGGPITAEEEGNVYGDATVHLGRLTRPPTP